VDEISWAKDLLSEPVKRIERPLREKSTNTHGVEPATRGSRIGITDGTGAVARR
jgi:hypothetical protein